MQRVLTVAFTAVMILCNLAYCQKPIDAKTELANLQKLEGLQIAAKAKLAKAPNDVKKKKEYVALTLMLANNTQASMALSSKEKYPKALRLYREVLKADSKNKEALENKNRIESIYRSMGRPIPK